VLWRPPTDVRESTEADQARLQPYERPKEDEERVSVGAEELMRIDDDERATRDADPAYLSPAYVGTRLRAPRKPLLLLPQRLSQLTGPAFGTDDVSASDSDLTKQHDGEPLGERIIVSGRVLGSDGRPVRSALIEIWQANAAGRYRHQVDRHPAPLDPNFSGGGRVLTDDDGRYRFVTIKPGAYPWRNHDNAWRPAHIHLSVFGRAFSERLVTQMYFPGDPLFAYDPIYQSVRDPAARERTISVFDLAATTPEWALAYRFDIVLGCARATPLENA
jgi:protocatechuate 3,4-dioxygenase beta subunit